MSQRNGDRARFQKDRKRKLLRRQRLAQFRQGLQARPPEPVDGGAAGAAPAGDAGGDGR